MPTIPILDDKQASFEIQKVMDEVALKGNTKSRIASILNYLNTRTGVAWSLKGNNTLSSAYLGSINEADLTLIRNAQVYISLLSGGITNISGKVGINTPSPKAALEINSTSDGFLIPRLFQAQINLIVNPVESLMLFNKDTKKYQFYNNGKWVNFISEEDITNIYDEVVSGIKGVATQSNVPTAYVDGYLFERWVVNAPITSPNSWGNITVTAEELDENFVFFNVTNGVVSKELSKKPENSIDLSPEFDPTTETEAQGGKQIFDFLKSISFDGQNMILQGDTPYVDSQFQGWNTYLGSSIGSDGSGSFAFIPAVAGVEKAVVYKDLDYPQKPLKIIVDVEQASDDLVLYMDDSTDPPGLRHNLISGTNTILWDATAHPDRTVIIRNNSTLQNAKIRSIKITDVGDLPNTKIPLNVDKSSSFNFEKLKEIEIFESANTDNVGSANVSFTNGNLIMTGAGSFSKYAQINYSTLHENSEIEFIYKENSSSGAFFGFQSQNALGYKHNVYMAYHTSGANVGHIEVLHGSGMSSAGLSNASNSNYTLGDVLKLSVKRKGLKYVFSVLNLTKGWKIEHTIQTTPLGFPIVAHNEARPSIICYVGSVKVLQFKMTSFSGEIENYIAGDSITFGQSATSEDLRWANLVNGENLISGGGADVTINVKNRLEEIKLLKPMRVLLMIGGNDILFGVNSATWQQNLRDIRMELNQVGIEVVHCLPTPRAGAGQLINFIKNEPTFATDLKIDTNTLLGNSTESLKSEYNSGDNLHPNNAGMAKIAEIINDVL